MEYYHDLLLPMQPVKPYNTFCTFKNWDLCVSRRVQGTK